MANVIRPGELSHATTLRSWHPQYQVRVPSRLPALLSASAGIDLEAIVEALQCLKSFIHQDLLFREVVSAAQEEEDLDLVDQDPANHEANASEVVRDGEDWSWDKLVEGLEDEEQPRAVTLTI